MVLHLIWSLCRTHHQVCSNPEHYEGGEKSQFQTIGILSYTPGP